jgi:hypothetical protein
MGDFNSIGGENGSYEKVDEEKENQVVHTVVMKMRFKKRKTKLCIWKETGTAIKSIKLFLTTFQQL